MHQGVGIISLCILLEKDGVRAWGGGGGWGCTGKNVTGNCGYDINERPFSIPNNLKKMK